jgi:hypothetical protein
MYAPCVEQSMKLAQRSEYEGESHVTPDFSFSKSWTVSVSVRDTYKSVEYPNSKRMLLFLTEKGIQNRAS